MPRLKLYMNFVFVCFLLLMTSPLKGQDFKEDMRKMAAYYQQNDFSLEVHLSIHSSRSGVINRRALIQKNGRNLYYELDKSKMFYSEEVSLLINDTEKDIVLRKVTPKEFEAAVNGAVQINIDSLVSKYDSVSYALIENYKVYTIYTSKSAVKKTVIRLDSTDSSIRQMEYFYNKVYTGEVTRTVAVFSDFLTKKEYTTSTFVRKSGDRFQLTSAYNNYNLILADTQ